MMRKTSLLYASRLELESSLEIAFELSVLVSLPGDISPGLPLVPCFPGHATGTGAGTDCEPLVGEPGFQYAADDVEGACLDDAAPDGLAAADADVDEALKGEGEAVCGLFVEGVGVEGGDGPGGPGVGGGEAVEGGGVFWGRGGDAKVVEDADEAFEAAVCGHDFADAGGGGGEVGEMCEGVEEGEGRGRVEG